MILIKVAAYVFWLIGSFVEIVILPAIVLTSIVICVLITLILHTDQKISEIPPFPDKGKGQISNLTTCLSNTNSQSFSEIFLSKSKCFQFLYFIYGNCVIQLIE